MTRVKTVGVLTLVKYIDMKNYMLITGGDYRIMRYNPNLHKRKSIRLKGFNYSDSGKYFITICTENRECILGIVENEKVEINNIGEMVRDFWLKLEDKFDNIRIEEYVVMPNHIHGIITITNVGANPCVCPKDSREFTKDIILCSNKDSGGHMGPPLQKIIQWYKTMTSNEYIKNVKQKNWTPFNKRFWQRNYYEHVIRDEEELRKILSYIKYNPLKWELDINNPTKA